MKIIAHRGASGRHPEMTRDAYLTAFDLRADGVECDIQLTADGVPVCLHDPAVDRTTDGTGRVNSMTLAELQELNCGTADRPQRVLTLAELLELTLDAQRPAEGYRPEIFVETKRLETRAERRGQLERALQTALEDAGLADGPGRDLVHLISFDAGSLVRFRRLNPGVHTVWLRKDYPGWRALRHGEPAVVPAGVVDSPGFALSRVRRAPDTLTRGTYLYTLNRREDLLWAARHGVEWAATDHPDLARGWLAGATRFHG